MIFLKKLRANLFGYFWLPCPLCGEFFGGFEIGKKSVLVNGTRKICCKKCD